MREPGVFLIHGLGGTQYDLGSMHKRLKNAGFVTHSLTLPGHGTRPEDLVDVRVEDWLAAVREKYLEVRAQHDVLHLMGMCMGSLLAVETAKRERHDKGKLVVLAPPVYIDGWATPWYRGARGLLYRVPGVPARMKVMEEDPYGIKNEQLRAIVKAKFERGENFHYGWVPLACIREVDRLRGFVMTGLDQIVCPTLVVHAREDELTSLRSASYLVEHIGGKTRAGLARMVVLEDSYHMVCVDNDREIVARNVLEFLDASTAASLGMGPVDAAMPPAEVLALLGSVRQWLEMGDFAALFGAGIPDFAWLQPGHNRSSGVWRGTKGLARLKGWAQGDAPVHFGAFGMPSLNAGVAVLPATLQAGTFASPGVLAVALRAGRLLEVRWFPDDVAIEDAYFGGQPAAAGPSALEKAFAEAAAVSKTLRQAPDNDTLLALYSLYKQGSAGDVTGERPGMMDMVGRAKWDAWAARRGTGAAEAMQGYVTLVAELKGRETVAA
ncbi:acyl-CoA-binding protein [Cupriavidus agavae]|uniref:Carboxylesterase n=1 Tax=Cupriavidus agavae TaxID=1001822 RepID=A0A4Q7RG46_9BURK|nr:acyl-CoA-binding protein [Cupriavidus agavae]RZT31378.1 carboxylesterase [Cupriavidus agavae]